MSLGPTPLKNAFSTLDFILENLAQFVSHTGLSLSAGRVVDVFPLNINCRTVLSNNDGIRNEHLFQLSRGYAVGGGTIN